MTSCRLDLGDSTLIDLKFLNDTTLILICSEPGLLASVYLLSLANLSQDKTHGVMSVSVQSLPYGVYDAASPAAVQSVSTDGFTTYRFPAEQTLRPVQMDVHDKTSLRGDLPVRICLLGSNRTSLRTFSIPS